MAEAPGSVDDRLVWIDLEMTGLDLERNRIVEIAVLVTDAQLEVLAEGLDLVVHQPPEQGRDAPGARRHSRVGRRAPLLPRHDHAAADACAGAIGVEAGDLIMREVRAAHPAARSPNGRGPSCP